MTSRSRLRTFVATVDDVPGVVNRVASLFRRRSYNIVSLTVGQSELAGLSRLTVVVEADDATAARLEASLWKLCDLIDVVELEPADAIERDLALLKVKADAATRAQVIQIAQLFGARVVDINPDTLVVEITDARDRIDGLRRVLEPFGIVELVRTGVIAMPRATPPRSTPPQLDAATRGT